MSYWDTSALGKLYLPEADSPAFARKAASATVIVTAKLALYEMQRVAFRKVSDGLIPANTAETVLSQMDRDIAAGEIRVVEMDSQAEAEFNAIMARCYRQAAWLLAVPTLRRRRCGWPFRKTPGWPSVLQAKAWAKTG